MKDYQLLSLYMTNCNTPMLQYIGNLIQVYRRLKPSMTSFLDVCMDISESIEIIGKTKKIIQRV